MLPTPKYMKYKECPLELKKECKQLNNMSYKLASEVNMHLWKNPLIGE
jgi:hypothetical protein